MQWQVTEVDDICTPQETHNLHYVWQIHSDTLDAPWFLSAFLVFQLGRSYGRLDLSDELQHE